jgi:hypothetical protein
MKGTEQAEQGKEKASTHHRRTQPSTSVGPSHATLSLSGRPQIAVTASLSSFFTVAKSKPLLGSFHLFFSSSIKKKRSVPITNQIPKFDFLWLQFQDFTFV